MNREGFKKFTFNSLKPSFKRTHDILAELGMWIDKMKRAARLTGHHFQAIEVTRYSGHGVDSRHMLLEYKITKMK